MKVQKKKTTLNTFLDILFKALVVIAILIFVYIAATKVDFSAGELTFESKGKTKVEADTPSQLKWFDDFKGVENVPNKKQKEEKSKSSNTGFTYKGF